MPDLSPAIDQLKASYDVMRTNAPINEREGNRSQAELERNNAKSYREAIKMLKQPLFSYERPKRKAK